MPQGTQVLCVSSALGAALLTAALDDGMLGPADTRRILLAANTAEVPEIVPPHHGLAALARRVDDLIDWNALIAPLHPRWYPPATELPLLGRLVRHRLGVEDAPVELVLDSPAGTPWSSVAALLPRGPITVYSDSLLAFGPPPRPLTSEQAGRVIRVLHLPVLADRPVRMLADAGPGVTCSPVPAGGLRSALLAMGAEPVPEGMAVVVGAPPADHGLLDDAGHRAVTRDLLRGLAARGHRDVVIVPHPDARVPDSLLAAATELGLRLTVRGDGQPAEAVMAASRSVFVAGAASAALILAQDVFGLPVATVGADRMLAHRPDDRIAGRTTAALVHATVPALRPDGTTTPPPAEAQDGVDVVAYSLGPDVLGELRPRVADFVSGHEPRPYVGHERLISLGLREAPDPEPVPAAERPAPEPTPRPGRTALGRIRRAVRH